MLKGKSKKECMKIAQEYGATYVAYLENIKGIPVMIEMTLADGRRLWGAFDHHTRRVK